MTAVCESCLTTMDVTDENYRILTQYFAKTQAFSPTVPLGTRGELMGKRWEVIGFLVRKDIASSYTWNEYLLFNPYYGYRWLTENAGHWSFVTPIKAKPTKGYRIASFANEDYKLFTDGWVEVSYVLGEFYWLVQVGKLVQMSDYIRPPKMLSAEKDESEVQWSVSEYLEPAVIQKAFKLQQALPPRTGSGANQPSRWEKPCREITLLWMLFLFILTFLQGWQMSKAAQQRIFEGKYNYTTNQRSLNSITTPVFTAKVPLANLELDFSTAVDNSWLYLSGEFVNNKTGETYPFDRSIEFYQGYDSDGHWTEGSQNSSMLIASIPGGDYYLNLDTESGGFKLTGLPEQFSVAVRSDVPTYANYFWCLLFISILPAVVWWKQFSFENSRWSNSDLASPSHPDSEDSE